MMIDECVFVLASHQKWPVFIMVGRTEHRMYVDYSSSFRKIESRQNSSRYLASISCIFVLFSFLRMNRAVPFEDVLSDKPSFIF